MLRPYQQRGLAWLTEMADLGWVACWPTTWAWARPSRSWPCTSPAGPDGRPTLVVCPASVLANWEREAARFAPGVPTRRFHGPGRDLDGLAPDEIVVATYGVVRRDAEALAAVGWGLVVADEAQAVKNPQCPHRPGPAAHPGRRPVRPHRHPRGEPPHRAVGDPRLDHARAARAARALPHRRGPAHRARPGRGGGRDRCAGSSAPSCSGARRATRPSPPTCRRRPRPTGSCPSPSSRRPSTGPSPTRCWPRSRRPQGMARRGLVLKLLTALKQICNHPAQYLAPGRAARRPVGQARRRRRAAGDRHRRGRGRPGLHPVRGHGAAAGGPPHRARPAHVLPPRLAVHRGPGGPGGPLPGRRGRRLRDLARGRRDGHQPHPGHPRRALRPLVEPGGGGPGQRPGVAHRPDPPGPGPPPDLRGHGGGPHRHAARPPSGTWPMPSSGRARPGSPSWTTRPWPSSWSCSVGGP